MVLTESPADALGRKAPGFDLRDPAGNRVCLDDFSDAPALVVAFWCNHCPYVKHLKAAFAAFAREYQKKNVAVVAINANDADSYPADSPTAMQRDIDAYKYSFPYLVDADQSVARAFGAVCTPEFYVYDSQHVLAYRGRFDGATPGNREEVTGADLRTAVEAVLEGRPVPAPHHPAMGCSIKWKHGNAP